MKEINKDNVSRATNTALDATMELLKKEKFEPSDYAKITVLETLKAILHEANMLMQNDVAEGKLTIRKERIQHLTNRSKQ